MPLNTLTEHDLRHYCKKHIETLENWLRNLIDYKFSEEFGKEYFSIKEGENNLIKSEIQKKAIDRKSKEPDRYPRLIDATLFEDLVYIICNPSLYKRFFEESFKYSFPDGNNEARTFLTRLLEPRNKLAHSNPISVRQAEQIICYSNDIIDSIKQFYIINKMNKEFNVPSIIKIIDSKGNCIYPNQNNEGNRIFDISKHSQNTLFPGDNITLEVEIDSSFGRSDYEIYWQKNHTVVNEFHDLTKISIDILTKDICQTFYVECFLKTKNEWHKYHNSYDDEICLVYKVLPNK